MMCNYCFDFYKNYYLSLSEKEYFLTSFELENI